MEVGSILSYIIVKSLIWLKDEIWEQRKEEKRKNKEKTWEEKKRLEELKEEQGKSDRIWIEKKRLEEERERKIREERKRLKEERERRILLKEEQKQKKEKEERLRKQQLGIQRILDESELKDELTVVGTLKSRHIPSDVQKEVWERDKGKCVECGSRENLEYDHIIPVSKGSRKSDKIG
jgi:5-methylcytosine-specific restriction endonuclease McrA